MKKDGSWLQAVSAAVWQAAGSLVMYRSAATYSLCCGLHRFAWWDWPVPGVRSAHVMSFRIAPWPGRYTVLWSVAAYTPCQHSRVPPLVALPVPAARGRQCHCALYRAAGAMNLCVPPGYLSFRFRCQRVSDGSRHRRGKCVIQKLRQSWSVRRLRFARQNQDSRYFPPIPAAHNDRPFHQSCYRNNIPGAPSVQNRHIRNHIRNDTGARIHDAGQTNIHGKNQTSKIRGKSRTRDYSSNDGARRTGNASGCRNRTTMACIPCKCSCHSNRDCNCKRTCW